MLKDFPNIAYEISTSEVIAIKDFFNELTFFFEEYQQNRSFFEEYLIYDNETPESISAGRYSSKKYWFIILLINKRTDPFYDWVLSNDELMEYAKKFVTENYTEVRQYVLQRPSILENMSELFGETVTDYTPSNPSDPENKFVSYMIDRYYTELNLENNERRKIFLPSQDLMIKIYNNYLKLVNDF